MSKSIDPTPEQERQCEHVHRALCNEVNLMGREGIHPAIILSAIGKTACDLITTQFGSRAVAEWFEAQAKLVRDLQSGG